MKQLIVMEDPRKQESIKKRKFAFRINLFFFFTFILFSVLIVRLATLQFVDGKELKAEEAAVNKADTPIPPIRGNIYDRQSAPLAYTISTQSLYFRVEQNQPKDKVVELAYKLEEIFGLYGKTAPNQIKAPDIIKAMDVGYDLEKNKTAKEPSYNAVPRRIKSDLSEQEMAFIYEHRDELKWIEITEESIRTYEKETTPAAQLIGYMRPFSQAREPKNGLPFYRDKKAEGYLDTEDVGYDGIELMYQEELRGKNGSKTYPVNALQKIVGKVEITKPVKGNNLFLSIDKNVQLLTEQAITDHLAWLKGPEARNYPANKGRNAVAGYAVAMEVETGKVVAMASMPDYDPSVWFGGISQDDYNRIQPFINNGTITTAYPDYPREDLSKHPTSIVYVGSTIKPLSVLIGLNEGLFGVNSIYHDVGVFYYGKDNSKLSNSDGTAFGSINPTQAIRVSSNTFMSAKVGIPMYQKYLKSAPDKWKEYLGQFGLGLTTGSNLPREYEGLSEFQSNTKESEQSRMVFASWGQNEKYTTLQLAQYVTTLANRGKRLRPILVDRIETYDGELVKTFDQAEVLNEVHFSKQHWDAVINGMESNVQGFANFPYQLVRKTGTSTQKVGGGKEVDNAVFIGFAPKNNPKLAVAVVVPEGGFGSFGAAPIARKIFDAYDQYYGLDGNGPKGNAVP
ncbi:peptidoglycan D,D-transpeptidase FtsI family protein [Paenibacillus allorhizosphaerae]|uniref:Penicillin-binding protein 2B n=1 Tax=Paenibacillus allorhizosphaerae TaxID=2849866 RepID=A0ABM8V9V2_9BACL|nr:penicillin-binding transpeptidase domain-containing protein [Paenibacillus allorhizosphaerae]CAG7614243.1 Penicillin-binding protein 2B [Paenibacillus allorhizosphaerae]